jgi:hypothetical protein
VSKAILTVGFELSSEDIESADIGSRASLWDYDIILIRPTIEGFVDSMYEEFEGKPCLSDGSSFRLKESMAHWRDQIKKVVDNGKTVIVFLSPVTDVFIATGEKTYTGSGRSQRTNRMVGKINNYEMLPVDAIFSNSSGSGMVLSATGKELIGQYWDKLSQYSNYHVTIKSDSMKTLITTRTGGQVVSSMLRHSKSPGSIVALPDIKQFYFTTEGKDEEERIATAKLISQIVSIDKLLRSSAESTPAPSWASNKAYALARERILQSKLVDSESRAQAIQREKQTLLSEISQISQLRDLLYEKGKSLEKAIVLALQLLGFSASNFKEGRSEFDVVFESAEGRLLGEAEGKDTKAVNVDKLRQLEMNIHEDFEREEVTSPAKAVLFANAFRLIEPKDRECQFTEKCITAALRSSTALVARLIPLTQVPVDVVSEAGRA